MSWHRQMFATAEGLVDRYEQEGQTRRQRAAAEHPPCGCEMVVA